MQKNVVQTSVDLQVCQQNLGWLGNSKLSITRKFLDFVHQYLH